MTVYKIIIAKSWANQRRGLPGHAISSRQISLFPLRSELYSSLCGLLLPGHLYWLTTLLGFHEKPETSPPLPEGLGHVFMCLPQKHEAYHLFGLKSFSFQRLDLKFLNCKTPQKNSSGQPSEHAPPLQKSVIN